jgi:2-oxoglutarate dehydrogenase E2 component (dihydrolipoamide succinyltransferase)
MASINVILPAMGEGVIEATITKWLVKEGAEVKEEDPVVEVATDKVDTEIPAPAAGKISSIIGKEGSVVKVGEVIAIIESGVSLKSEPEKVEKEVFRIKETIEADRKERKEIETASNELKSRTPSGKFVSPLVRSIASREAVSYSELDTIPGSGMDGRITKDDILQYVEEKKKGGRKAKTEETAKATRREEPEAQKPAEPPVEEQPLKAEEPVNEEAPVRTEPKKAEAEPGKGPLPERLSPGDEVIEMDRVRKIIAEHMVMSKRTSAHVTSFIDIDMTRIVNWRNSIKDKFLAKEGIKLTLTPIFIDALARAISEIPMLNISVEGNYIIKKKNINIGMATALPSDNLIVPVIKNANDKSLTGLARAVNDLADRARKNKLKPDEITGGTFTLTNYGSYSNLAGSPIINQPQVAILGTGAVKKVPAVIETPEGDVIGIRQIMIASLSYDHRVIDGALAGKFLQKFKQILENYTLDYP